MIREAEDILLRAQGRVPQHQEGLRIRESEILITRSLKGMKAQRMRTPGVYQIN
jgi:hypothetical protein